MKVKPDAIFRTDPSLPIAAHLTPAAAKDAKLHETVEDFAGMLYAEVFSQLMPTDQDPDGLFSGNEIGMFMPFLDQALGKSMAQGSGNALAQELYHQLTSKDAGATP